MATTLKENLDYLLGRDDVISNIIDKVSTISKLTGLEVSNGTDAINDIDFSSGSILDSTGDYIISLNGKTKQADATWAAGTGAGGMASGVTFAENTFYLFALGQSDGESNDFGFDTDIDATNLMADSAVIAAGFDIYARIATLQTFSAEWPTILENRYNSSGYYDLKIQPNLTGASSDYTLKVGESAKVDITTASTPLNVAVGDGVYEIELLFDQSTFASDSNALLNANNTTYTGEFLYTNTRLSPTFSTDEIDVATGTLDAHCIAITNQLSLIQVSMKLHILDNISSSIASVFGKNAGNAFRHEVMTVWDAGTAHTSLGTLVLDEAANGVAYIKRVA